MKLLLLLTMTLFSTLSLATGLGAEAICTGKVSLPNGNSEILEVSSFVNLNNYCVEDTANFDKKTAFTVKKKNDAIYMGSVVTAQMSITGQNIEMVSSDQDAIMTLSYSYATQYAKLEVVPTNGVAQTVILSCHMIQYNMECED